MSHQATQNKYRFFTPSSKKRQTPSNFQQRVTKSTLRHSQSQKNGRPSKIRTDMSGSNVTKSKNLTNSLFSFTNPEQSKHITSRHKNNLSSVESSDMFACILTPKKINELIFQKAIQMIEKVKYYNRNHVQTKVEMLLKYPQSIIMNSENQKNALKLECKSLYELFKIAFLSDSPSLSTFTQNYQTSIGNLLFYIGLGISMSGIENNQANAKKKIQVYHFQIYFSLKLEMFQIALDALHNCGLVSQKSEDYQSSVLFYEQELKLALVEGIKFYEESAIENMGICSYYQGNISEAQYFHNNIGKMTQDSKRKFCQGYSHSRYLAEVYEFLFENKPLKKKSLNYNQKYLIVFEQPRQLYHDYLEHKIKKAMKSVSEMQKYTETKEVAYKMRKGMKINEKVGKVTKIRTQATQQIQGSLQKLRKSIFHQSAEVLMTHKQFLYSHTKKRTEIKNEYLANKDVSSKFFKKKQHRIPIKFNKKQKGDKPFFASMPSRDQIEKQLFLMFLKDIWSRESPNDGW